MLLFGGASLFVWVMMFYSLRHGFDQALHTEALALASRLELERDRIEFEVPPGESLLNTATGGALVQIVGDDGSTVFASPEIAQVGGLISESMMARSNSEWKDTRIGASKQAFRAFIFRADVKAEENKHDVGHSQAKRHAWVFVARPLQALHDSLRRLVGVLLLTVMTAGAAAILIGYLVSRSGTEPIRSLSDDLGRVKPERLELTVDQRLVPVELDPIIRTVEDLLARIRSEIERQQQLTADVAHDLRTPLAGVRTLLDVCVRRIREPSEYIETIHKAQAALRQLSGLVENVLDLARLDAKSDRSDLAKLSISEVIDAAIATVQPLADTRGIFIERQFSEVLEFLSDRTKLTTILSNLLTNAIEHSPYGETVKVITRADEHRIEILIEDHGSGVPVTFRERIFERFVRADESRSVIGHHGLGLPIARGLARLLGGDVVLDDSCSTGCRFVVVLSRRPESQD